MMSNNVITYFIFSVIFLKLYVEECCKIVQFDE